MTKKSEVIKKPEEPYGNDLGPVLKEWFRRNSWTQIVAEKVAKAKESEIGPWASQISNTMAGKIQPKPSFFVALGWFNDVIMTRDFREVTDRRIMDMLISSEALCHDDGQPFTATDFFSLYLGELDPPEDYLHTRAKITKEDCTRHWSEIRTTFKELSLETMLEPIEVWHQIEAGLQKRDIHADEIDWIRQVIVGLREPTLDECLRLRAKHPEMPLIDVLRELKQKSGGSLDRLEKSINGLLEPAVSTLEAQLLCA